MMEAYILKDKVDGLRRAVAFGKENGKRNLIVDLDLLDEILRGNVPVGGNQYPPEDVNAKLYEIKAQRDKLLWKLSDICDLADDELRRLGAVPGSNVSQIEADARAVLDEVRESILPRSDYDVREQPEGMPDTFMPPPRPEHVAEHEALKQDFIEAVRESTLTPPQKAEWERVVIWEAINEYTVACGGDTSDATVSDRRMNAVAAVERALAPMGLSTALVNERGAIVSSADCSEMELAFARKEGRFFVDTNGYGFVLRLKLWRENAELALKHLKPVPEAGTAYPPDCAFALPEDPRWEALGGNTAKPLTCANCGEVSTNPGQFTPDGLWLCTEACRKELCEKQSYDDLAASGGIVDAP